MARLRGGLRGVLAGAVAVVLLVMSASGGASVHRVEVAVRGKGEDAVVSISSLIDGGNRRLRGESLDKLSHAESGDVSLTVWLPQSLSPDDRSRLIVPAIDPSDPVASRTFWGPMRWTLSSLQDRFGHAFPGLHVDLIVVPKGVRFRHKSRFPVSQGLPMRFALDGPEAGDAPWVTEFLLLRAHAIAAHEYFHVLVALASKDRRFPNKVSEEAVAYLFGTCATLASQAFDQAIVLSPAPPDPAWIAEARTLSGSALWRSYSEHHGISQFLLEPTHRGAILAALALDEIVQGERFLRSDAARERVDRFCGGKYDVRTDWVRSRPRFD